LEMSWPICIQWAFFTRNGSLEKVVSNQIASLWGS
jgi:hypothetical protein